MLDLARNARDAMPEGGQFRLETTTVELDEVFLTANPGPQPGRYARIDVSDTGPGMDDPARVFDPFFTAHVRGGGTGIGLAAAYGIVKQHGGSISAESVSDGGTMFRIYLPIREDAGVLAPGPR
jgi:two-component system, cell cycle sensor histidine kinase and response regulator CckA